MKKILFASTALVASAGIAAAEVSFSGEAGIGFVYNDAASDWSLNHYTTLSVSMTGETDGGLSFGASFDITTGSTGGAVGASSAFIEGGFGKLSAGDVDNAVQTVTGLSDIGYSGLGTDNVAEGIRGLSQANVLYEGTFGDFGVALSHDLGGTDDTAVAFSYTMGDYSIGLGYGTYSGISVGGFGVAFADRQNMISAQVGANIGDIALAALYSQTSFDGAAVLTDEATGATAAIADTSGTKVQELGLTAAYTMGAVTVTAAYSQQKVTGLADVDAYGLGVAYDLGGGASINAGVGEVGGATVADLGIIMTF